jgi:hypothetical protein
MQQYQDNHFRSNDQQLTPTVCRRNMEWLSILTYIAGFPQFVRHVIYDKELSVSEGGSA